MYYFLKIGSEKNVSNFFVYIIKFISFNPGDTVLYPGVSLGTPVLCEDLIYLYQNNSLWFEVDTDTGMHKVIHNFKWDA